MFQSVKTRFWDRPYRGADKLDSATLSWQELSWKLRVVLGTGGLWRRGYHLVWELSPSSRVFHECFTTTWGTPRLVALLASLLPEQSRIPSRRVLRLCQDYFRDQYLRPVRWLRPCFQHFLRTSWGCHFMFYHNQTQKYHKNIKIPPPLEFSTSSALFLHGFQLPQPVIFILSDRGPHDTYLQDKLGSLRKLKVCMMVHTFSFLL